MKRSIWPAMLGEFIANIVCGIGSLMVTTLLSAAAQKTHPIIPLFGFLVFSVVSFVLGGVGAAAGFYKVHGEPMSGPDKWRFVRWMTFWAMTFSVTAFAAILAVASLFVPNMPQNISNWVWFMLFLIQLAITMLFYRIQVIDPNQRLGRKLVDKFFPRAS